MVNIELGVSNMNYELIMTLLLCDKTTAKEFVSNVMTISSYETRTPVSYGAAAAALASAAA